jgi:hypothetical protein
MRLTKFLAFLIIGATILSCSGDSNNEESSGHIYKITVVGYIEGNDDAQVVTYYDGENSNQQFSNVLPPSNFYIEDSGTAHTDVSVYVLPGIDSQISSIVVDIEDLQQGETVVHRELTKTLVYGLTTPTATEAGSVSINYDLSSGVTMVDYGE